MQIKKLSAVALSALMATTAMLPMNAFAQQEPSVEYTGGDGSNITHLYLIADDTNLANNNTVEYNQLNAKVQVPVAINYVAEADGDIIGPDDGEAQIRNFSGFPVNVTNIKVNAGTNVTLVSTAAGADAADKIYLQMKPNSGTILSMADYTASATETSTGSANGTGKRPTAGTEWNIAAAQSGVGTNAAEASALNLNALSGKIGGFNRLDPAQKQEIGQIEWTVKPGTYAESKPAINASMFTYSASNMEALHAVGDYITGTGKTDATYINNVKSFVGTEMTVPLKEGQGTMKVRLVSVDNNHGLTFEAEDILIRAVMNSEANNSGGWASMPLRASMNQGAIDSNDDPVPGGIYETYFQGTDWDQYVRTVENLSFDKLYPLTPVESNDKYWLPSANNIAGADWSYPTGSMSTNSDGDPQFDYYANMDPALTVKTSADTRLIKNFNGSAANWWLRSARPGYDYNFMRVRKEGGLSDAGADIEHGVVPCFCL